MCYIACSLEVFWRLRTLQEDTPHQHEVFTFDFLNPAKRSWSTQMEGVKCSKTGVKLIGSSNVWTTAKQAPSSLVSIPAATQERTRCTRTTQQPTEPFYIVKRTISFQVVLESTKSAHIERNSEEDSNYFQEICTSGCSQHFSWTQGVIREKHIGLSIEIHQQGNLLVWQQ